MRICVLYPGPMFSVRDVARGYHRALALEGHDVLPLNYPSRVAWYRTAMESHGHNTSDEGRVEEQVLRRASESCVVDALRYDAELVLVVSAMYMHPDAFTLFSRAGIRTATIFTESPYQDEQQLYLAGLTDVAFVNDPISINAFRAENRSTFHLPPAYDPEIHRPIVTSAEQCDVLFVGTGFRNRLRMLEAVDWSGIDLKLYGQFDWEDEEDNNQLKKFVVGGPVANEQVPWLYASTKIVLNFHRSSKGWGADERIDGAWATNPRTYEVAACEAFQIADARPELGAVFGDTIVTVEGADDLASEINYYLAHDADREALAREARAKVEGCTFRDRARDAIEMIASA